MSQDTNTSAEDHDSFHDEQSSSVEDAFVETEAKPRKKRSPLKIVLIVISSLLALILIAVGVIALVVNQAFNGMKDIGDPFSEISNRPTRAAASPDGTAPVNFLIMGSDSRISAGDPTAWEAGAQRTDALLLVQVSGNRESISIMSIPRDSWVDIPGVGEAKINAAFSYGGPALTIETVEQLTGVHVDHIAIVDFTSFTALTDIVGGVDLTTTEGTKHYNGEDALTFVRERYSLPSGDFDRVRRQQAWIKAVLEKLMTPDVLSSPSNLMQIYNSMKDYISVDDGLGVTTLIDLGTSLRGISSENITMLTAPYLGTGTSDDGQSIVLLDMDTLAEISKAFQSDTVDSWVEINAGRVETLDSRPLR